MPVVILFAGMLGLMFMRVHLPFAGSKARGRVLKTVDLSFPERVIMQRVNIYAIAGVLLMTTITGLLNTEIEFIVVAVSMIILAFPVRAIITSEGIGINNVVFRPWSDFTGFSVERRRIQLVGTEGTRPLNIPLLGGNQKAAVPTLRRFLKPVTIAATSATLTQPAR
jgi:hypothetical protein